MARFITFDNGFTYFDVEDIKKIQLTLEKKIVRKTEHNDYGEYAYFIVEFDEQIVYQSLEYPHYENEYTNKDELRRFNKEVTRVRDLLAELIQ